MTTHLWFPLYDGDLLTGTMHLSPAEFGCYMRLIVHAYNHHGEIPNDDRRLAQITGCTPRQWGNIKGTVLQFFDTVDRLTLQHKRVCTELHRAAELSLKRKAAAEQMHSKRRANAHANGGVITAQHIREEPSASLARSNGSLGAGSKLTPEEVDRLLASYEKQCGHPWTEGTKHGGTISPERKR